MTDGAFSLGEILLTNELLNQGYLNKHRRVVKVHAVDEYTVRYRVSLDFTVPQLNIPTPARLLLPLGVVPKRLLSDVDALDEWDHRLPIINRRLGHALTAELVLLWWVTKYVAQSGQPIDYPGAEQALRDGGFAQWISKIVSSEAPVAADDPMLQAALATVRGTDVIVLQSLVQFVQRRGLVFAIIDQPVPGERRVVKFAYTTAWSPRVPLLSIWKRVFKRPITESLFGATVVVDALNGSDAESAHFEFAAPAGLVVEDAILTTSAGRLVDAIDESKHMSHVHLYSHNEFDASTCEYRLGISQRGWIRSAVLAAVVGAVFVCVSLGWIGRLQENNSSIYAATTILALGAVAAIFVARPNEHPVTTIRLAAPRSALLISAMCTLVTILVLLFEHAGERLSWWAIALHGVVVGLVWMCVLYLWLCWRGPAWYAARRRKERSLAAADWEPAGGRR